MRFLRVGLDAKSEWPSVEQTITYGGHQITLCPETDEVAPSVLLKLDGSLSQVDARRLLNELLSALTWVKGGGLVETLSVFGSCPIRVGKLRARVISDAPVDYLPIPKDGKGKLALALYREAISINSIPYAFLGFFKILNVLHQHGAAQKAWINATLPKITEWRARKRLSELQAATPDVGSYLYTSGRCAVAHAFGNPTVNPDDPEHVMRLGADLPLIRALAEHAIEHELGVKSHHTFLTEHLYELEGFRDVLGAALIGKVKSPTPPERDQLPIPPVMSLRLRGVDRLTTFEAMAANIVEIKNGLVQLRLLSASGLLEAHVILDFAGERLLFNAMEYVQIQDDGSAAAAQGCRDYLLFLKKWFANGVTEIWDGASQKLLGRAQPTIMLNCMPDWVALDHQIEEADQELARRAEREKKSN